MGQQLHYNGYCGGCSSSANVDIDWWCVSDTVSYSFWTAKIWITAVRACKESSQGSQFLSIHRHPLFLNLCASLNKTMTCNHLSQSTVSLWRPLWKITKWSKGTWSLKQNLYIYSPWPTLTSTGFSWFRGTFNCWSTHSWVDQFQEREFPSRSETNESSCCRSRCYRGTNAQHCLLLRGEIVACDSGVKPWKHPLLFLLSFPSL